MEEEPDRSVILSKIQETYVPFLKKLTSFLEKTKKASPDNLNRLKHIYTVFTTASADEKIENFYANKEKLETWLRKTNKDKGGSGSSKGVKRSFSVSDNESSQDGSESSSNSKKKKSLKGSDELSISAVRSVSSNPPAASDNSPIPTIPLSQIKKEKEDAKSSPRKIAPVAPLVKGSPVPAPKPPVPAPNPPAPAPNPPVLAPKLPVPAPKPASQPTPQTQQKSGNDTVIAPQGQITFTCASCQFQTLDENEFIKHARTDHRTDLSMWCKQCGKCFSNAGVLVSHIKERSCVKEDMIYRCGVKDCSFETPSGQTFVHHLRHCHKGSPFIFCVHCQKIFTLPHCLILHMQDDCPFKQKNRKNPSDPSVAEPTTTVTAPTPPTAAVRPILSPVVRPPAPTPAPSSQIVRPAITTQISSPSIIRGKIIPTRGTRGRGRGRGRGRVLSESSDSDDPDDPSWRPEEIMGSTPLRRSGRWAKKVNDAVNVEPTPEGMPVPTAKKTLSMAELDSNEMLNCPCCDFMATFKSVLEDHYIANHKVSNKNACLACHLKFENTKLFLEHFEDHAKGILANKPATESNIDAPVDVEPSTPSVPEKAVETNGNSIEKASEEPKHPFSLDNVSLDGVVENITVATIANPASGDKIIIPYQAAIHDKNKKDCKLKKFEDLKSLTDVIEMRKTDHLMNFFKCVVYNCVYSCNDKDEYAKHLQSKHCGKRLNCAYCFQEFYSGDELSNHTLVKHNQRRYQCSNCFYRAYSKIHVQIHIKSTHMKDASSETLTCDLIEIPENLKPASIDEPLNTTWPFVCAIGDCTFYTFDPKEFKKHNDQAHRSVSVFFCHYCKVDFISVKRLLNHYRLHGINTYQCSYCIHGSETNEEIMLHLCVDHADLPLKAFMRGTKDDASAEAKQLSVRSEKDTLHPESLKDSTADVKAASDEKKIEKISESFETQLYDVIGSSYYPKSLHNICSDVPCGIPCCKAKFENIPSYMQHLKKIHSALNFCCPYCPKVCEAWEDFKMHLTCHGPDLYACGSKGCDYYNWGKNIVTEHMKTHSNSDIEMIVIRECSTEIKNDFDVSKLRSLSSENPLSVGEKSFECLFCMYKSSDFKVMKNHMYNEMAYKRFSCSFCSIKCFSRKEIKNHFESSHSDYDIKCTLKSNPDLEDLVKKYLNENCKVSDFESTRKCCICNKEFESQRDWQSHIYACVKKEYRPYDCGYCKDNFSDLKLIKYHVDQAHFPKTMQYSVVASLPVEYEINANLMDMRLKFLQEISKYDSENKTKVSALSNFKYYFCSICKYESDYKFNVVKHIGARHKNENAVVEKSTRKSENSMFQLDENSNDSVKNTDSSAQGTNSSQVKRFRCGFCIKKMFTIEELESHVEGLHPVRGETEYYYYYSPDSKINFSAEDKEIYECAYCKSSKENLFALKKHSDLMHSEMPFKVKGYVTRNKEQCSYFACGHCYLRLENKAELKSHFSTSHPGLPVKSIGNLTSGSLKRPLEEIDESGNKQIRFGADVFVCSHCGGAFLSLEQITFHSKRTHARLQLDFKKIPQSQTTSDLRFYKCEFCSFIGEKPYLDKHLSTKHKMRVSCFHCKKRFEFATKLKEHHDVFHKGLPVKYCQETISTFENTESKRTISGEGKRVYALNEAKPNVDKKEPEASDLGKLTIQMETKEGPSTNVPVVYFSQLFNIHPKVILKDVRKEN